MYVMQITVKIDGDLVRMVGLVGIQSIFQKGMPHLNSLGMGMISECLEDSPLGVSLQRLPRSASLAERATPRGERPASGPAIVNQGLISKCQLTKTLDVSLIVSPAMEGQN